MSRSSKYWITLALLGASLPSCSFVQGVVEGAKGQITKLNAPERVVPERPFDPAPERQRLARDAVRRADAFAALGYHEAAAANYRKSNQLAPNAEASAGLRRLESERTSGSSLLTDTDPR